MKDLELLEENAIKMESVASLLANASPDLTLASAQGALWVLGDLAKDVRDSADRTRMKYASAESERELATVHPIASV